MSSGGNHTQRKTVGSIKRIKIIFIKSYLLCTKILFENVYGVFLSLNSGAGCGVFFGSAGISMTLLTLASGFPKQQLAVY